MSQALEQVTYIPAQAAQTSLLQGATHPTAPAGKVSGTPRVFITGDLHLRVPESVVTAWPVRGSYWIETQEMREPLQVIWSAEGQVLTGEATSTDIEFDMRGARTGQTWTYVVAAQVTEGDGHSCIVSGVFVQILVTGDDPPCETA